MLLRMTGDAIGYLFLVSWVVTPEATAIGCQGQHGQKKAVLKRKDFVVICIGKGVRVDVF